MSAEISAVPAAARLRITETFLSLQGEANAVGWPTFFIRLTGCPLRCHYCDTAYAFHGGEWRTLARLVDEARESRARHVCVTGGEPLAQRECTRLLTVLCEAGFEVSLETSGAIDASGVDPRVARVIDVKTPASGESRRNLDLSVHGLRAGDQLKFVICDRADYEWSRDRVRGERLDGRCQVLFSPSYQQLPAARLANWILEDRLPVRFQVQLHKVLWGDVPGR
ncbi:MAG TPA: 7-carboxy-7-deazaguanine synthase QueE [Steroidobacteraceae bacterium]|jgi:7-carboxy-7-deazaguanine synthase|nr:7-carboxy-7-deazaguanine synthase QueE [Steroidobacteraceae bacterium]